MYPTTGLRRTGYVCQRCLRSSRVSIINAFERPAVLLKPLSKLPRQDLQRSNPFSTTSSVHKKSAAKRKDADAAAETKAEDPQDFSVLERGLAQVQEKLKADLSKLRAGGRFNPQVVDDLRVKLDKDNRETERLGDLAQVVPKGRLLNVVVGEKDYVKAVSSAIAGSNLSLTPQVDPHNPLQLNIQLPPPTADSRKQAVQEANKAADAANGALRNTRQAEHKRLQAMRKTTRPDDLRKAEQNMEKIVQKAGEEVKKIADSARKVLESG